MLPPIPQGLVPVTVQQDPVKPRPEIRPVTPPAESEANSQVRLEDRPAGRQDAEQHDRQPAEGQEDEDVSEESLMPGNKPMSRKGVLVNIRV